ncbi:MAG: membrane dipeptidase [Deltaproteobacteria bacterium]|nr:membrane dipeptidase [Deltaproteobacteria bacterium]
MPPCSSLISPPGRNPYGPAGKSRRIFTQGTRHTGNGGGGLTDRGRELIGRCESLGLIIDVSHASDRAFHDILLAAEKPMIASHSNCRSVCPNPRNLTDDMIRLLADRGGVMGINLGSGFVSPEFFQKEQGIREAFFASLRSKEKTFDEAMAISRKALVKIPRPPADLILEHVKRAIDVGGEDCAGLGGDLDGVDSTPEGIDHMGDYPRIVRLLEKGGLTQRQIEKVCYDNFRRVFLDAGLGA